MVGLFWVLFFSFVLLGGSYIWLLKINRSWENTSKSQAKLNANLLDVTRKLNRENIGLGREVSELRAKLLAKD